MINTKNEFMAKIYVSLNCLLDMRLGALGAIDVNFALDIMMSKEYYTREIDIFKTEALGELSREKLNEIYIHHKEKHLKSAIRTKMFLFIQELGTEYLHQAITSPFQSGVAIEINTYPYIFNDIEATELIATMISLLGDDFSINVSYISPKDLKISHVRDNYRAMILYDYHEWLNMHTDEIKKKPLKETGLYVPRLQFGEKLTDEQITILNENDTDLYTASKALLEPLISIQFLPIALYCAAVPDNKPEYLQQT
jgi:hypothetical protein